MKQFSILWSMLILCLLAATGHCAVVIANGNFEMSGAPISVFTEWETDPIFDSPLNTGSVALFEETGPIGSSQLAQSFTLPANAMTLSFEYRLLTSGIFTGGIPDSFQATLFNSAGDGLFPSDPNQPAFFPAFFSVDNSGAEFFDMNLPGTPFVSVLPFGGGARKVTLDLSSLALQQPATIDFLLNGSADGITTQVFLDNVTLVTAVPEPGSALYGLTVLAAAILPSITRRFQRGATKIDGR